MLIGLLLRPKRHFTTQDCKTGPNAGQGEPFEANRFVSCYVLLVEACFDMGSVSLLDASNSFESA